MRAEKPYLSFKNNDFLGMTNMKKSKENSSEMDALAVKETHKISKELFSKLNSIYWKSQIRSVLEDLQSPQGGQKSRICELRIHLALNSIRIYFPNRWSSLREIMEVIDNNLVSESTIRRYLAYYVSTGIIEKRVRKQRKWGKIGRPTNEFKNIGEKDKNGLVDDIEDRPPSIFKYLNLNDRISPKDSKTIDLQLIKNGTYEEIASESLKLSVRVLHKSKSMPEQLSELIYYLLNEEMGILRRMFEVFGVREYKELYAVCTTWGSTSKSIICSRIQTDIQGFPAKELNELVKALNKNPEDYNKFLYERVNKEETFVPNHN